MRGLANLTGLQRYIGGALLGALLIVGLWCWRVDPLRSGYKTLLNQVVIVLEPAVGRKVRLAQAPAMTEAVVLLSSRYRRERDNARGVVRVQSASIDRYAAETDRLIRLSEQNRKLAEATIRERDTWISRARSAETRTERRSAEQELEECNAVLDALYSDGF